MTQKTLPDLSKIKAFFFDAGGTLFRPYPSVGEIYCEVAFKHGLQTEAGALEKLFHSHWDEKDGLASLTNRTGQKEEKEWWRALVRDVFSKVGEIKNFEGFFEELYDRFARSEAWRLFPDALPILESLKKRGKIVGIISNWDSRLFGICEGLGLTPYLDFILASAAVGVAKPHPDIFKEALKRAEVSPQEALHVGDSLKDDVWGARQLGIHAIFIDRKRSRGLKTPEITTIQFLDELSED